MRVTPQEARRITLRRMVAVPFAIAAVGLVAAGCGSATTHPAASASSGSAGSVASTAPPTSAPSATTVAPVPAAPAAIMVGNTTLGSILTDGQGQTVYLFEKDTSTASKCYGACASAWPPVTTTAGQPTVGEGTNQAMLGTTMRTDGRTQLTYAGHPLYRYVGDHKSGDTTGQGLQAFGAGWDVLTPSGQKLEGGK